MDISKELGLEIEESEVDIKEISRFDFAYVTNSLLDLMKIRKIEGIEYKAENKVFDVIDREFKKQIYV